MASFEEKVEALRRLRERRQAREGNSAEVSKNEETSCEGLPEPAARVQADNSSSTSTLKAEAKTLDKRLDGQELTSVLEHYASGPDSVLRQPSAKDVDGEAAFPPNQGSDEADALYCLGHCFEMGIHECSEDKGQAAAYFSMAAEKGSVVAQWRLGHLHEYGEGVEKSGVQAAQWYRCAAEAGHAQAQSSLALLLEDGRAGVQDDADALRWHLAAAAQGQALSQYCASCCLFEGRGARKDEASAQMLLEKSSAAGFPLAVEAMERGSLWRHTESCNGFQDEDCEQSLLDIAARVAKQIEHLSDADADTFLNDLLGTVGDCSEGGAINLEDELDTSLPPVWSNGYPCVAAA